MDLSILPQTTAIKHQFSFAFDAVQLLFVWNVEKAKTYTSQEK